jgi:hypothetical protein
LRSHVDMRGRHAGVTRSRLRVTECPRGIKQLLEPEKSSSLAENHSCQRPETVEPHDGMPAFSLDSNLGAPTAHRQYVPGARSRDSGTLEWGVENRLQGESQLKHGTIPHRLVREAETSIQDCGVGLSSNLCFFFFLNKKALAFHTR